ncbi:MAG: ABC transporter permease [Archaeoglobales archaeon]|nr:MAG: ABC transporter permease [Archaeoglobales archaeon]
MLVELAVRNLKRTKIRSFLAAVGIVIGVMAISSIGIFGESLKAVILENFKDVANEIIVTPNYMKGFTSIDRRTIEKLEGFPYAEVVIPIKSESTLISCRDKRTYMTVYGMDLRDAREIFKLESGSYKGCLIGERVAEFFDLKVGKKVSVEGREFRVGGIIKSEARYDVSPNSIVLPLRDFDEIFESEFKMVIVKVERMEDVDRFEGLIEDVINRREEKVSVFKMRTIIEIINRAFWQVTLFLMAIAGVSLLVAGVSILNIMLMSTIERTREIGIMRAIGAYRETILKLFLVEALILGLIGSSIGGILSFVGGYAIDMLVLKTAKYVFQTSSFLYVVLGVTFGISTSLISAMYPAWKASRLEPIQALRYE